jgi:hypothetical protein
MDVELPLPELAHSRQQELRWKAAVGRIGGDRFDDRG